jgi:hypothetical protein
VTEEEEWERALWATDAAVTLIFGGVLIFAIGVLMQHYLN